MLSKMWASLSDSGVEEQEYLRRVLVAILTTGLLVVGVITLISFLAGYGTVYPVTSAVFVLTIILLWLTRRNLLTIPRLAIPLIAFGVAVYLTRNADGIRDEAMYVYPLTLVLAGLLLGKAGIVVYTVLDLAAMVVQALGEINGSLVTQFSAHTTYETIIVLGLLLGFMGVLFYLTIDRLQASMLLTRQNEQELAKRQRELQTIGISLEARTAQLRAGAEVSRAAASTFDPDELIHKVANLIVDRFGFYYAAIFTLDSTSPTALLREATGEAGRILKQRGHKLALNEQSIVAIAIHSRAAQIALDVGQAAVQFADPLLPHTRSEIALPLSVGERILGALDVQSAEEAAFDEANAAVLQSMADQIAVALANAESFTQLEHEREHLLIVSEAGRALSAKVSIAGVLESFLDLAPKLEAAYGSVLIIGPTGQAVFRSSLPVVASLSEAAANNFVQQVSKRSLERWIIDHQQAAIVFDTTTDSRWETLPETAEGRPVRSAVGVPLTGLREGFRGAIVLAQPTAHHFDDDHIAILRLVSLFLAIAFDNARLYEQTQQTLAELDDVNRRLTGDTWGTYLQHKSRASVIWVSKAGNLDRLSQPDVEQTLATNKISIQPLAGGNTTQVIVPLTLRGQPIGALQMHTPADAWNDDLQTIVTNIAGHIVQAVENTRLIEVTEERFARERALSESTDKIRRRTDVERILQTAAEELARRLQAARVAVRLEPDGGSAHVDANGDKRSNQS